jgi:hypothetical protein
MLICSFLGFGKYSIQAPFYLSMMVYFPKRFSGHDLIRIIELIAERDKAMVMEAVASTAEEDSPDDSGADADNQ